MPEFSVNKNYTKPFTMSCTHSYASGSVLPGTTPGDINNWFMEEVLWSSKFVKSEVKAKKVNIDRYIAWICHTERCDSIKLATFNIKQH